MTDDYKPIVMTKDGVYARGEGLIVPNVGAKKPIKTMRKPGDPITRGETEEELEEEHVVSRKDCVTTARKDK